MRILVVEDDKSIAETLERVLGEQHYVVDAATDGEMGWELVEVFAYDLIVLDVMLPKLNGIEFCQRLRSRGDRTPILLLTAKSSSTDKTTGLNAGADDYVVKPFDLPELLARIRVLLRRKNSLIPPVLEWGDLRLDPNTCEASYGSQPLRLTPKEYRLLELFLRNPQQVLTRNTILENLWSVEETPSEDTITAHIKSLRQKLKRAGSPPDSIATVYGIGYRLKSSAPSASEASCAPSATDKRAISSSIAISYSDATRSRIAQQTKSGLKVVWEKFQGQTKARVTILEQATAALRDDALDEELRQQAKAAAHKLAGTLGVFGFPEGSRLAKEIEQVFSKKTIVPTRSSHLSKRVVALRQLLEESSASQIAEPIARHRSPVLLVISDDAKAARRLVELAVASKIRIRLVLSITAAKEALAHGSLDVVLLVFSLTNAAKDNLAFLANLINQTPPTPVLFLTSSDNLTVRIEAARLCDRAFFQKLQLPERGLATMNKVLKQIRRRVAKVMVVDDDPQMLYVMKTLLEIWGIKVTTLEEPSRFWETLAKFSPDLLILDVEMPIFNGIELCRVVRNDPYWCGLPIVFVSVHTDEDTVNQILRAGGDDRISKSLIGPELVNRILNRLERVHTLRSLTNANNPQLR
ncbi:response regulator with CheY-like receiver domain and winged-helix DNA-binding domain [Pleurocapsa sp. PCC 7327]|uniref:response regulator n=1 Tax=Pleurocapsa sp. PCC 7327 TaxID=118163 RepID=UPI00029FE2BC|nr:response regulator [Pleurocapsa sp. PCC 7327]AFY77219.1 response regulator with CheY-like receiver domain and winged-helix DNA-binding domain [Pleurocapsa sp. PCC 7327]